MCNLATHWGPESVFGDDDATVEMLRLVGAILISQVATANAKVWTNALFSDGMVLQTAAEAGRPGRLFGNAAPHERVALVGMHTVTGDRFPGSPYRAVADATGHWSIEWSSTVPKSDGPYELVLSAITEHGRVVNEIPIHDVWLGDVYLCSGQSNMEKNVAYIYNATAYVFITYVSTCAKTCV